MANIITVSALNTYVHALLEEDPFLTDIAVQGEISNFNRHYKSGHCYFSLLDKKSSIKAVLFRAEAQRLSFQPENGLRVIARGRVSLYERDGAYQLYVDTLYPDGVGAAQLAFEQLKQRLEKEGLFAAEWKKPLPAYPQTVGLVTSKTGAALQDIVKIAQRRCPAAQFILAPVTVQGLDASEEIAKAIAQLDKTGLADVIIVTRGGGSAEDLWVFNTEEIARAIFACKTPVVSAIGHEIDYTIADFVADLRAPTPSAAAEMVLPDLRHTLHLMENLYRNIENSVYGKLESCYTQWKRLSQHPSLEQARQAPVLGLEKVKQSSTLVQKAMQARIKDAKTRLESAAALAAGLNPYMVLSRGYGILTSDNVAIGNARDVKIDQKINIAMHDGDIRCRVEEVSL